MPESTQLEDQVRAAVAKVLGGMAAGAHGSQPSTVPGGGTTGPGEQQGPGASPAPTVESLQTQLASLRQAHNDLVASVNDIRSALKLPPYVPPAAPGALSIRGS